jgi:DNA-binding transcriptional LysR family regulator
MTSLDLWESFALTHRERSVSAAARHLGVSQPAVSARLRRLEEQLGLQLFTRSRAGVVPTPTADALALRLGPLIDQLRLALAPDAPVVTGRLLIGGAADVVSARIVPALVPLIRGGLDVEVTTGLADDLLAALSAGRLDLVVSSVRPTRNDLTATAFVDEEFLLVAAPSVAAGVDQDLLAADPGRALGGVPLAAYAEHLPILRRYWLTEFEQRPAQRIGLVLPDLRGLLRAVVAGVGASVLPRYLVDQALLDGTVVRLHEPRLGPLNTLWLVTGPEPGRQVVSAVEHLRRAAAGWSST